MIPYVSFSSSKAPPPFGEDQEGALRRRYYLLTPAVSGIWSGGPEHWDMVECWPDEDLMLVKAERDHYVIIGPRVMDRERISLIKLDRHLPPGKWLCEFASKQTANNRAVWVTDVYLDYTSDPYYMAYEPDGTPA